MKKYKVTPEHPYLKSGLILIKSAIKLGSDTIFELECETNISFRKTLIKKWKKKGWIKKIFEIYDISKEDIKQKDNHIKHSRLKIGSYYSSKNSVKYVISKSEICGLIFNNNWFHTTGIPDLSEIKLSEGEKECTKEHYYSELLKYAKKRYKKGALVKWPLWDEREQIDRLYIDGDEIIATIINKSALVCPIYEGHEWIPIVGYKPE